MFKRGTPISLLPSRPYDTSEAHGRAVLLPKIIFDKIGLYDAEKFPHYGADTDFSFRAKRQGFKILIDPDSRVRLHTQNTGLQHEQSLGASWQGYWKYLTNRKNGEAGIVWWRLTRRHLPFINAVASFLFIISLNTIRYWGTVFSGVTKKTIG